MNRIGISVAGRDSSQSWRSMGTICIDNVSLFSRLSCGFRFIRKFVEEGFETLHTGGGAALCHNSPTLPRSGARDIQLYPVNVCLSCEIKSPTVGSTPSHIVWVFRTPQSPKMLSFRRDNP